MRIKCNLCGKPVSTEVPDDTVVRAWVECPECTDEEFKDLGREVTERRKNEANQS